MNILSNFLSIDITRSIIFQKGICYWLKKKRNEAYARMCPKNPSKIGFKEKFQPHICGQSVDINSWIFLLNVDYILKGI